MPADPYHPYVPQSEVERPDPSTATSVDERASDAAAVAELLGRPPRAAFEVVVRGSDGTPAVIRNAPILHDGTPMPTRYWLLDPDLVRRVSRLEASGGCRDAEESVDPDELVLCHRRYAAERDAAIPAAHRGSRPRGGVGGAGAGVKCLHAHYAYLLAGGHDPVGRWVQRRLAEEPS